MSKTSNLNNVKGKVSCIVSKTKAIVSFPLNGKEQNALLLYDRLKINGLSVAPAGSINNYLQEGSVINFDCHTLDGTGPDRVFCRIHPLTQLFIPWLLIIMLFPGGTRRKRSSIRCDWFAKVAWICSNNLENRSNPIYTDLGIEGKCNKEGTVIEISGRQGVLSFEDYGIEGKVFFRASTLFLYGNRVKANLSTYVELELGSVLMFDAVPCNKLENDYHCGWFATVVWKGSRKPFVEYDSVGTNAEAPQNYDILTEIKMVSLNPRSTFVSGIGQILHIMNEEYGLALGSIRHNHWDSILFHRSMCFLFKMCLSGRDLTKIFKEGDKISFIAVPAPKKFMVHWIATNISIYRGPSIKENFDMTIRLLKSH